MEGTASLYTLWKGRKSSYLPPTALPIRLQTHFFSQWLALQAPNHQPSGIFSCWEFHKAKVPMEFQQRCSESQNPTRFLAQLKSPAAESLPTLSAPCCSRFGPCVFFPWCQLQPIAGNSNHLDGCGFGETRLSQQL